MKHEAALIIRMCYRDLVSDAARWRFDFFEHEVLPRILDQTTNRFDIWVWTNPAHAEEVESMSQHITTFTVKTELSPLMSRIPWQSVVGVPRYPVQLRLDSDDLIGPRYVEIALASLRSLHKARSVVYFQPMKYELSTKSVYAMRKPYTGKRMSAFLALQQPTTPKHYNWVYGIGHTKMARFAEAVLSIPAGHCWMTVHDFNDTTALHRRDPRVSDPALQP